MTSDKQTFLQKCLKKTDFYMLTEFKKVFNCEYQTGKYDKLFQGLIPDGFYKGEQTFIIENKQYIKDKLNGLNQLKNYYEKYNKSVNENIYLVLGLGNTQKSFKYIIFSKDGIQTKLQFQDFIKNDQKPKFNDSVFHDLNQYLYDNGINLTKEQKLLFISAILLCLKEDKDFILTNKLEDKNGIIVAKSIIKQIQDVYNDQTFTQQFEFILKNIYNNHFLKIIKMIQQDMLDFQGDILNAFYREFVLWDRNNDAQNGVVLTPPDIVKIMTTLLDIKQDDNVLDFCTGTGSFLIEASKYTQNIFGCENNEQRYSLSKCGFILNDISINNLKHDSCFNIPYKQEFDKIIINPPFNCDCKDEDNQLKDIKWNEFNNEQKFILYGIQLLKDNGLMCVICPRSNFNNSSKQQNRFKKELLKYVSIQTIINLNSQVFQPNASVECVIVLMQRMQKDDQKIKVYNFEEDGYKIKKCKRILQKEVDWKIIFQERLLQPNEDWNYQKESKIDKLDLIKLFQQSQLNYQYQQLQKSIQNNSIQNEVVFKFQQIEIIDFEKRKVKDYFCIIKPKKTFQIQNSQEGQYPLISRSSQNNGVIKYINDYSLDGDFITVAPSGSTGSTFYQKGKFAVDNMLKILQLKIQSNDIEYRLWSIILNKSLSQKYSYNNGLTIEKLMNEEVDFPIIK